MLFVITTCLVSLPWLTPCGITILPATALFGADRALSGGHADPIHLTRSQNNAIAESGSLPFTVREHQPVPRSLLITTAEWERLRRDHWSLEDAGFGGLADAAMFLLSVDPVNNMQSNNGSSKNLPGEERRKVVLSQEPLVVLEADRVLFARSGKRVLPHLAEGKTESMLVNATLHSAAGKLFVVGQRICFRASSSELIVEGNAMVQSGHRQVRTANRHALMRINIHTRAVMVAGAVIDSEF